MVTGTTLLLGRACVAMPTPSAIDRIRRGERGVFRRPEWGTASKNSGSRKREGGIEGRNL